MVKLNDFYKNKVIGKVYLLQEDSTNALLYLNRALQIKEDPEVLEKIGMAYYYDREYKMAQEYFLKAIDCGDDCYALFKKVTVDNLRDMDKAVSVLKDGVTKHSAYACILLGDLHIENIINPDMVNYDEAERYLNLAYEYVQPDRKAEIAFILAQRCARLLRLTKNEKFASQKYFYLKECYKYNSSVQQDREILNYLFEAADACNDESVFEILSSELDGSAMLLFALLLLEEEYEQDKNISIQKSMGMFIAKQGANQHNGGCAVLAALCYGSDFKDSEYKPEFVKHYIEVSQKNPWRILERFRPMVRDLLTHLKPEFFNAKNKALA